MMILGRLFVPSVCWMFFIVPLMALAGNNSGAAFSTWPGTNVSTCYDADGNVITCPAVGQPFYGQDGNCPGPARSYTSLGSGTMVLDNVTSLVWEVKENRDETVDYTNPHDADNIYTWCDTNPDTNGGNQGTCGTNDTLDFIDALNAENFGGHDDWRMPTLNELVTLVDFSRNFPSINSTFFPETPVVRRLYHSSKYWSSTTNATGYTDQAWNVNFEEGTANGFRSKSDSYYVRAVRGGQ